MEFIAGTSEGLSEELFIGLAQYRHKVFVELLGWKNLHSQTGLELDQFDRPDTVYVVAREQGRIVGVARLLPTLHPYLLEEVFPNLLGGALPPRSADVWELSRFAAIGCQSDVPTGQMSASTFDLLHAVQECARKHGANRLIMVTALGVERMLRKGGFRAYRAGPPQIIDGHPVFACWIDLPAAPGTVN